MVLHLRFPAISAVIGAKRTSLQCNAATSEFSSPKTGSVGSERFKENAVEGTYWGRPVKDGENMSVVFDTGSAEITVSAVAGENLLRLAEKYKVLTPTNDFCFEGTCCHCEMVVEGGAREIGYRADPNPSELVRSCICPVPAVNGELRVSVISEDDAWGDTVV